MNTSEKNFGRPPKFRDVSRYTRWVNQLDEEDRKLTTGKRKGKWILVLLILLMVFIISFLMFPSIRLGHKRPDWNERSSPKDLQDRTASPTYDMPVDTFEQLLKQRVHENLSEKK